MIIHRWYYKIDIVVRVFVNGLRCRGSIPGRVMPKAIKMVPNTSILNTQHYKVRIKGKWSNPGKGVTPFPTSPYWKGRLQVTLNYDHQLYYPGKGVTPFPSPRCSSYWKGSLRIALIYGWPTLLIIENDWNTFWIVVFTILQTTNTHSKAMNPTFSLSKL